jgi:hypothetical protein
MCINVSAQIKQIYLRKTRTLDTRQNRPLIRGNATKQLWQQWSESLHNNALPSNPQQRCQSRIHPKIRKIERKIYNLSADICFNQTCLRNNTDPNLATIKISNVSPVCKLTQHKTSVTKIRDGIKIPWLKISSDHEPQDGLGAKTRRLIAIFKVTWTWTALKGYAGREFYFFCTTQKKCES